MNIQSNACPHPGPLPQGEGERHHAAGGSKTCRLETGHWNPGHFDLIDDRGGLGRMGVRTPGRCAVFSLSPGVRAGVRASVNCCLQFGCANGPAPRSANSLPPLSQQGAEAYNLFEHTPVRQPKRRLCSAPPPHIKTLRAQPRPVPFIALTFQPTFLPTHR